MIDSSGVNQMSDFSFVKSREFADAICDADDDHVLNEALWWIETNIDLKDVDFIEAACEKHLEDTCEGCDKERICCKCDEELT